MRSDFIEQYCIAAISEMAIFNHESILDFTTSSGVVKAIEFGRVEDFVDHRVYSDGYFVFDPRFSSDPVPIYTYIERMKELNPGLIVGDVTP